MKIINKKFILLISIVCVGLLILVYSISTVAQRDKKNNHEIPQGSDARKCIMLFGKIRQASDSNKMIHYDYSLNYDIDDSTSELVNGEVYKKRNFSFDSNDVQLTYNDNNDFFSINHKVQLAIYSNLKELKKNLVKNEENSRNDSLKVHFQKIHSLDFSDSLVTYFVSTDRSYENENKIVIDVDFIDECPMTKYYLSFDKKRQLADSMIVHMIEADDVTVDEDEMNNNEEQTYYKNLIASETYITFKAFNFSRGKFGVEDRVKDYIDTKGDKVYLVKNRNYNLTVLK